MPNDMNRWNNAKGYSLYDLFADEGRSSIDENTGYLDIELGGRHHLQLALDMLGVSLFANSDLFLHGFTFSDFVTDTKEQTNQAAASFFENGLKFGKTSMTGNILATASLQKENDIYSNKIDEYYGMGSSVVIINIPHHYKDIHMGKAERGDTYQSYEEKTARMEHQRAIAIDGIGLDAIPKEFIVGVFFRDYTKPDAMGSGRLILNPNYLGFENNLQSTPNGEVSNYDSLKNTIMNAPLYNNNIVYDMETNGEAEYVNSEDERINMAIIGSLSLEESFEENTVDVDTTVDSNDNELI